MTDMPKVFLVHGFLGVGKTTFAKRLAEEHGALRISPDEWMSRLYGSDPEAACFAGNARRIAVISEEIWTRCLDLGTNVVLDFGFWSRSERLRTRSIAEDRGGAVSLYRVTCNERVAWRRVSKRNARLAGSLHITRNTFDVLKTRFEPLGDDEPRQEVETS